MSKKISLLLVFVLILAMLAGCSKSESKDTKSEQTADKVATTAEKLEAGQQANAEPVEDTLTMYIGVVEEQALKIAQEFEAATGIKVEFVRMSGGEILSRIRAEKNAPKASIWYGGPADSFVAAKAEGLLQPYMSPNAHKIPADMKDAEGYWTGIYNEVLGFVVDTRFFEERGIEKPKTWDDLLKPEFKEQIMIANPGSSGTAFLFLSGMVQERGEEAGLEYMKKFDNSVKQYTKSGSAPAMSAGLGEAAIGITFMHNGLRHIEEGFDNIEVISPEEGTWYSTAAVGIIADAPQPGAAKKFVDWSLTTQAQEIGQQFGSFQFPTNPEAKIPEQALPLKDAKLLPYDLNWSGEHRSELVAKWDKLIKSDAKTE